MQPLVPGPQLVVELVLLGRVTVDEPSDGGVSEQSVEGLVEADDDRPEGVEVDLGQDIDPEVLG